MFVNGGATTRLDNFGGGTYMGLLSPQPDAAFRTLAYRDSEPSTVSGVPAVVVTPPANQTWRSYYYLGGKRIAMRTRYGNGNPDVVNYLHGDHLGSTSLTTSSTGAVVSSSKYYPYGADRPGGSGTLPTDYKFTGQRQDANIGLYDYGARFYDSLLGRFISADTIVPGAGDPQSFNRYTYVGNSPLKYRDPSGHWIESAIDLALIAYDLHQISQEGLTPVNSVALVADVASLLLPGITGGGPATRLAFAGGEAVLQAASHASQAIDVVQAGAKILQFAKQLPLPGFEDFFGKKEPPPGRAAEDWVSEQINVPRNAGPNRVELKADYFTSKTKTRIPEFDPRLTPGKLVEVKDRAHVGLTENLPDFIEYARRNSLKVELWIRKNTTLESDLLKLTQGNDPLVILKYLE